MRRVRGPGATVGLIAAGCAGVALAAAAVAEGPILSSGWGLVAIIAGWWLSWAGAVVLARRVPQRRCLLIVLGLALGVRLVALGGLPTLSDDLYRYAWDGHVQAAGINPYRFPPDDARLRRLRDPWLWPDRAGCAAIARPPGCTRINRPSVPTIYPPLAEAWFRTVFAVDGLGHRDRTWQAAAALVDLVTIGLVLAALRSAGRDPRLVAAYALCPAAVLETAQNGHVDGLALALVLAAVVAARARRPGLAGALVGGAGLVKLYPLVLLPAVVVAEPRPRRRAAAVRAGAAAAAVFVLGYVPHVLTVGWKVVGYLPGYLREEKYVSGGRFLLLGLPPPVAAGVIAVALVVVIVRAVLPSDRPEAAATVILGTLLLLATPVQPWYALVLAGLATVAGAWGWFAVVAGGYAYFAAVILQTPHAPAVGRVAYGAAALVVVAAAWLRRTRSPTPSV